MQNSDARVLIVVPAYNEGASIRNTLHNLLTIKQEIPALDICVINDGSADNTADVVREFKNVILVDLPYNLGIGGAVQTGYKFANDYGYDIAIQFDADGQHNADALQKIITSITEDDTDMVVGSRFLEKTDYKGALSRRIGIYYFTYLLLALTGKRFTDPTSGYRAINRRVIEIFANDYPRDYPEPEVLISLTRKKFKIKEITVNMKSRQGGRSSITPFKSIYYMFKVTLSIVMQKIVKE
ncbi:glycosyltransferase family 2 protein [Jeotgalibacillus aurantiacus]|uniref:glycosyltransferase family 2 protein n=1 Tax=Jeotgalibacillus aurantiacus TaxID=2763266 RepID=UPI001D0ACCE4|nr:glycosyltransferase family 2 protein [Jeotgalibacillus aurantiacus]